MEDDMVQKPRTFVGKVHSVGEIDTSTHRSNRSRMVTLELRWNLGLGKALFRASGKMGDQVINYLTGDKIRITAVKTNETLAGLDIYDIQNVEMV